MNPIISFLFLYNQYLLKQIDQLLLELFNETNIYNRPLSLRCTYCGHTLAAVKDRKHFRIHKCKLHYIYREFTIDFFKMDLNELPYSAVAWKNGTNILNIWYNML